MASSADIRVSFFEIRGSGGIFEILAQSMNVGCMRKGDRARARKRVDSCVQSHDLQMTTGLRTENPGLGCGYILIADPVLVVATIVSSGPTSTYLLANRCISHLQCF
jgi:hypothetical protein